MNAMPNARHVHGADEAPYYGSCGYCLVREDRIAELEAERDAAYAELLALYRAQGEHCECFGRIERMETLPHAAGCIYGRALAQEETR